jgi:hypothetical protein
MSPHPRNTRTRRARTTGAAACLALGTATLGAGLVPAAGAETTSVPGPGTVLPDFLLADEPLAPLDLAFEPTGENIFPHVVRAADYVEDPLGTYYLYYAPHERPGGIAMVYGDSLDGPWTEYEANPLVSNVWAPHYSVSHVSSPHVIWNEVEQQFFLFFHGENSATRYATSPDGITWTYGGVAVTSDGTTGPETSYARVFEHEVEGMGNRYVMVFMDNPTTGSVFAGGRTIRWAVSDDMRDWQIQPEPLVVPGPDNLRNVSGPWFMDWGGTHLVAYHGSDGDMWATEVGPAFDRAVPLGRIHLALDGPPDRGRSAAPAFYVEDDRLHVFYEAGSRLSATIAHAVGDLRPTDDVARDLTCTPSVDSLWPPDGRTVQVEVDVRLEDGVLGPLAFELAAVDADGDAGDVSGADLGTPDTTVALRAARPGDGGDRTYALTYSGRDEMGRPASCTVQVTVPHDQRRVD